MLRFTPEAARDAKSFLFHPTQEQIGNKDGSLTVRFSAGGLEEMCRHLFTWGTGVAVEEPALLGNACSECAPTLPNTTPARMKPHKSRNAFEMNKARNRDRPTRPSGSDGALCRPGGCSWNRRRPVGNTEEGPQSKTTWTTKASSRISRSSAFLPQGQSSALFGTGRGVLALQANSWAPNRVERCSAKPLPVPRGKGKRICFISSEDIRCPRPDNGIGSLLFPAYISGKG